MKKSLSLILAAIMLMSIFAGAAANSPKAADDPVEVVVFAAASMTKALTEIGEAYKEVAPNVTLTFTFDSSGTLRTQIVEGAYCDVFISAGQKQMNDIDIASKDNEKKQDFVLADTRFDLLENEIVLAVPAGNPAKIESFDDLGTDKLTLLAIGNSDVPVGKYAAEILTNLKLYDKLNDAGKITFGSNTTEVTTQVAEGTVDAGIIYRTDVASAVDPTALEIVAVAPEGTVARAIYPAAVINVSKHPEESKAFLEYLRGDEAKAVLDKYGFMTDFAK